MRYSHLAEVIPIGQVLTFPFDTAVVGTYCYVGAGLVTTITAPLAISSFLNANVMHRYTSF